MHILRFMLLVMLIFLVILISIVPFAIKMGTHHLIMVLLPLPPVLFALILVPHELLKDFAICTSVELLKDPKTIAKVCRIMRLKKSLRAVKLLRSLQSQSVANKSNDTPETITVDVASLSAQEAKQYEELGDTFTIFDMDGSGSVDLHELGGLMQALGISLDDSEKACMMKEFDKDNSGSISFDEFFTYMQRRTHEVDAREVVKDVFEMMDSDGSGSVTAAEFVVSHTKRIIISENILFYSIFYDILV